MAEAELAAGAPEAARACLDGALPVFEDVSSLREIDQSRELLRRLN